MARGGRIAVEFLQDAIRVRREDRVLTIPAAPDDAGEADLLVFLDEVAAWDPPHEAAAIDVAELQRILEAVEREAERRGVSLAYD